MKRLIITALPLAVMLTACGNSSKNPEEHVKAENFTVYTSAAVPETATVPMTESVTELSEKRKFSYALNGTSVEFFIDGEKVKQLDYYYSPDEKSITVADFNFDGYDDIFIPYESYYAGYGYYYCYIPEKNDFEENEELAAIGRAMKVTGEGILTEEQDDGYTERYIDYQWTNGKLKPFRKTETYTSYSDGKVHTDIYKYDTDGNEYLDSTIINEDTSEEETVSAAD